MLHMGWDGIRGFGKQLISKTKVGWSSELVLSLQVMNVKKQKSRLIIIVHNFTI